MNPLRTLLFFLVLSGTLLSCSGPDESPKALVNILLVDAPAQWDSVIVEIEGVELDFVPSGREGEIQKIFLPYESGDKEVDISQLVAGVALPLARNEMRLGVIAGITLRLGVENSLYLDKVRYPLDLPGGNTDYSQPLNVDLQSGLSYDLILDFDLEKSVTMTGSDPKSFDFKPTISAFAGIGRGDLSGTIGPADLSPAIYAINQTGSVSTHTSSAGSFSFRLDPGNYTVLIDPKDGSYEADTVYNVRVETGKNTALERIILVKK